MDDRVARVQPAARIERRGRAFDLDSDHKSILTELVKRYTRMKVQEVVDGMRVESDCAYIIPPSDDMALVNGRLNGRLRLLEPRAPHGLRLPIDFFRSLAQDQHERAARPNASPPTAEGYP